MAKLIVEFPDAPAKTFELEAEVTTVGRVSENTIFIDDPSVSSYHAEITFSNGAYTLRDLESTNGTRHNGSPVTSVQLHDGDALRFGKVAASFGNAAQGESKPLPETGSLEAVVADTSSKPSGFSNASPFKQQAKKEKDLTPILYGLAGLGIAALAFALLQVYNLQPPQ